jgi:AcrR family transcriptional regulator
VPPPTSPPQDKADRTEDLDRKTVLADAAIDVLGNDGLRALTHRAVEARAGLPVGTCGYHYKTRAALLAAALHRIADLDRHDADEALSALIPAPPARDDDGNESQGIDDGTGWGGMSELMELVERAGPVEVFATLLERGPLAAPERTRARLVLMIDPEARRELGDVAADVTGGFAAGAAMLAGSAERGRLLLALLDGLVVDAVTRGRPDRNPARLRDEIRAVWQAATT